MGAVRGLLASPRFPSPLIKPDVRISRIRLSDWLHRRLTDGHPDGCAQPQHSQRSKDHFIARSGGCLARAPCAAVFRKCRTRLVDMVVDRPVRQHPGPIAKVARPASQNLIQPVPHFRATVPCCRAPAGRPTFCRSRATLFFDGLAPKILMAILPVVLRPERVSQKVKSLPAGFPDAGLRLVQGQSQSASSPAASNPAPAAALSAAQDHEIVRVVDHVRPESCFPVR